MLIPKTNAKRGIFPYLLFVGIVFMFTGCVPAPLPAVIPEKSEEIRIGSTHVTATSSAATTSSTQPALDMPAQEDFEAQQINTYAIVSVIDGDTFKVDINGTIETVRMIGINTPETVDPRKSVECFGSESSKRAKELLSGKRVRLEADPTQAERDRYGRLLRYAYLQDGGFFNEIMIVEGYAHEYTYGAPYIYRDAFRNAELGAQSAKRGLWADSACSKADSSVPEAQSPSTQEATPTQCSIKGNISSEKIYHLPGCGSYDKTIIDESKGERWFCTEAEALAAGWRKAKNCPQ